MARLVVIGGGPGGSTAATMLRRAGHDVVVFERERFPRDHIGESLLPASMPILEELGVADALAATGSLRKWGATMVWGRDRQPWSWYFRETNTRHPHAYQVWRPQFDQLLLDNARAAGADVREGHRVTDVLFGSGGRAEAVRWQAEDGSAQGTTDADFVIDASGQAALIGHALGIRRWDRDFRNMAVYGYFEGGRRLDPPDETNILVEAYEGGWFWVIPLHTGRASVGAVIDQDTARTGLRGDRLEPFLLGEIAKTTKARELLAGARLVAGPTSLRDWSYLSDRVVGDGWILVGDAACFIDPLFSSGVHLALSAGMLAAAYVASALDDPAMAAAAGPVYQELYYSQYHRFHELAKLFYASNKTVESYFWEARRILGAQAGGADEPARLDFIRAVAGQPPQGYERVVLAQGELPAAFTGAVERAEAELSGRRAELASRGRALLAAVPVLASGVRVERQPVLEQGRFVWGESLRSPTRREGVPVSRLVALLVGAIDGRRTVAEVIGEVLAASGLGSDRQAALGPSLRFALETLYVEGAVAQLR